MKSLQQDSHDGIAPGRPSHAHHGQPAGHPPGGVFAEGPGGGAAHHTHHAHMVADFQRRFWVSLVLTAPLLALAPMIQHWLGLRELLHFPGDSLIAFGLATVIFFYGGRPFLTGFFDELRKRQPGMINARFLRVSRAGGVRIRNSAARASPSTETVEDVTPQDEDAAGEP
jgi:Cu2+-exporting ATPase